MNRAEVVIADTTTIPAQCTFGWNIPLYNSHLFQVSIMTSTFGKPIYRLYVRFDLDIKCLTIIVGQLFLSDPS